MLKKKALIVLLLSSTINFAMQRGKDVMRRSSSHEFLYIQRTLEQDGTSNFPALVANAAVKNSAALVNGASDPINVRQAFSLPENASTEALATRLSELRTIYKDNPSVLHGFELLAHFHGVLKKS